MKEFSIYHIFRILLKNFFAILLSAILFGVAAFCYCELYLEERYASIGSVVVTNGGILNSDIQTQQTINGDKVNNSDIAASINLLTTVKDILQTNDIYKELSKELGGEYTYAQLKSFASVSKRDEYSLFIDVRFEMNNKNDVSRITDKFLDLTPEYISKFIPNTSVAVVHSSGIPFKTYPSVLFYTALAMFLGAALAFGIFYILSMFNTTICSEEEFKERYDITVLGDIPDFTAAKSRKFKKSYHKGGRYYGN